MSKAQQQQQEGSKQPIINISNVITNTNQQQEVGSKQPAEPGGEQKKTTTMSLSMETAIASVAGAAIGIGSSFLPKEYALPLALGAAIVVPKRNKGLSTALILMLSWLIMFTIFYQP